MLTSRRPRRAGFTLAEVLTAVAIIAVLASVMIPAVSSRMQDGYEDAIIQEFQSLSSAITAYRQDVGHYPRELDLLTTFRSSGSQDICNITVSATDSAKWNGPYVARYITTNSSYDIAQRDAVQDFIFVNGAKNQIYIEIIGPDAVTAQHIDYKIDGALDPASGSLQYTPGGNSLTLEYHIPIRKNGC